MNLNCDIGRNLNNIIGQQVLDIVLDSKTYNCYAVRIKFKFKQNQ